MQHGWCPDGRAELCRWRPLSWRRPKPPLPLLPLTGKRAPFLSLRIRMEEATVRTTCYRRGTSCTPSCKDGYTSTPAQCSDAGVLTAPQCLLECPASEASAPSNINETVGAETCVKTLKAEETCTPDCKEGYTEVDAWCVERMVTDCRPWPAHRSRATRLLFPTTRRMVMSWATAQPRCRQGTSALRVARMGTRRWTECRISPRPIRAWKKSSRVMTGQREEW